MDNFHKRNGRAEGCEILTFLPTIEVVVAVMPRTLEPVDRVPLHRFQRDSRTTELLDGFQPLCTPYGAGMYSVLRVGFMVDEDLISSASHIP